MAMLHSYRLLTFLISPLLPLWLILRSLRGKEELARIGERFGYPSYRRPKGTVLWIHAASVGEANSVLLLIEQFRKNFPAIHILLTTGTVTSAQLMARRLPKGVIHQYVPVDTPQSTKRFISHWRPDFAFWVESEFWPNLIMAARKAESFMAVINARMSERSFQGWQRMPSLIRPMLSAFNCMYAQSEIDGKRLTELGAKHVSCVGNLKFDAALLPYDETELARLKDIFGNRPTWLAASTHHNEESYASMVHQVLAPRRAGLLTVIVPRHPERGKTIAENLKGKFKVALRSAGQSVTSSTDIYIADTLGELGLFYRLCETVFMGGSLVRHGGQNPLEPARLACGIITGPYTHNFSDIYRELEEEGACVRVKNTTELTLQIDMLLDGTATLESLQSNAKRWVESKSGTAERLVETLRPALEIGVVAA